MIGTDNKDYYYQARVYKQKAVKKQVEEDIKTMVYTLLRSDTRRLEINKCESKEGYNCYQSCKGSLKDICPSKNKKYQGIIKNYDKELDRWIKEYYFHSDSELGVYLKVLESVLANELYFPSII